MPVIAKTITPIRKSQIIQQVSLCMPTLDIICIVRQNKHNEKITRPRRIQVRRTTLADGYADIVCYRSLSCGNSFGRIEIGSFEMQRQIRG